MICLHRYCTRLTQETGHQALKCPMTSEQLTSQGSLHGWSLNLQEYDFGICYRPGSAMCSLLCLIGPLQLLPIGDVLAGCIVLAGPQGPGRACHREGLSG